VNSRSTAFFQGTAASVAMRPILVVDRVVWFQLRKTLERSTSVEGNFNVRDHRRTQTIEFISPERPGGKRLAEVVHLVPDWEVFFLGSQGTRAMVRPSR
jgi:hypothetical protein